MGSWWLQGRERVVVPVVVLVVALGVAAAGGLGPFDRGSGDGGGDPGSRAGTDPEDDEGDQGDEGDQDDRAQELLAASYAPGDCVTYESDTMAPAETHVVPCTEPHKLQMTALTEIDPSTAQYPTTEEWWVLTEAACRPVAAEFLGIPLDPYGRFAPTALVPSERSWDQGDRSHVWCAIGAWAQPESRELLELAEDVRGADQAFHHPVGTCLSMASGSTAVVACTEPHNREIVGEVDLSDRIERPVDVPQDQALADQCSARARAYLGADPVPPWQIGRESMTEERWAAGTRVVQCFLGQWDAQDRSIEVTGSAKG